MCWCLLPLLHAPQQRQANVAQMPAWCVHCPEPCQCHRQGSFVSDWVRLWVSQGCTLHLHRPLQNDSPLCVWRGAGDMCMGWKHSAVSVLDYRKFWGAFSRYSWFICESQLGTCPIKADFPGKLSIQTGFFIDSQWRLKVGHHRHRSMKGLLLTQSNQINYIFSSSIKK